MVGIEKLSPGTSESRRLTRRAALGGAFAGLAAGAVNGVGVPAGAAAEGVDGIAGGGVLPNGAGEVQFSLAVVQVPREGQAPMLTGAFVLSDPDASEGAALIRSTELAKFTAYSTERPHARQIIGWATVNGSGSLPFLLLVKDTSAPGAGEDTFNLVVGQAAARFLAAQGRACDCGQYSYRLRGALSSGDLTAIAPPA